MKRTSIQYIARPYHQGLDDTTFGSVVDAAERAVLDPGVVRHLPEIAEEFQSVESARAAAPTREASSRFMLSTLVGHETRTLGVVSMSTSLNNHPDTISQLERAGVSRALGANTCYWVDRTDSSRIPRGKGADLGELMMHLAREYSPGEPWLILAPNERIAGQTVRDPSREHRAWMRRRTAYMRGWYPAYGIQQNAYALYTHDSIEKPLPGRLREAAEGFWYVADIT